MRIKTWMYELCLSAFVIISAILVLHSTAAAQICSSGVCVSTWQQDTGVPDISAAAFQSSGSSSSTAAFRRGRTALRF